VRVRGRSFLHYSMPPYDVIVVEEAGDMTIILLLRVSPGVLLLPAPILHRPPPLLYFQSCSRRYCVPPPPYRFGGLRTYIYTCACACVCVWRAYMCVYTDKQFSPFVIGPYPAGIKTPSTNEQAVTRAIIRRPHNVLHYV